MDCGSKGCRFKSCFLPMNIFKFLFFYNFFFFNIALFKKQYLTIFLTKFSFLMNYFILNELLWQDGFLIDFLQKKITDNWIKKFLIHSSYLINERLFFDKIIKFYLNLIIWPMHNLFIFELNNISNILFITIFSFIFFFILIIFILSFILII